MDKLSNNKNAKNTAVSVTTTEASAEYKLKTVLRHLNMSTFDYDIQTDTIYVRKDYVLLEDFTNYWFEDDGEDFYVLKNVSLRINEIIRNSFLDIVIKDLEQIKHNVSGEMISLDAPIVYRNGNTRWTNLVFDTILDENGKPTHAIGYCKDIHQQKKELYRLRNIAQTDSLTGFRNKISGQFKIETRISEEKDATYFFAVIDLDKFKEANDMFGHSFGDMILKDVADRIREFFDHDTICCRTGGDEFLFFRVCENSEAAMNLLTRLKQHVRHIVEYQNSEYKVDCSVGYSLYPIQGLSYEELYDKADMAMYYAKNNALDAPAFYNDTMKCIQK